MNIFHYFFGNDKQRAEFIFDFIAPFYGHIDKALSEGYRKSCERLNEEIPLAELSILDIGTGTGAWISSISKHSRNKAVGTDFSKKMLYQAKKNHPNIEFIHADGENLSSFEDNSFDVVTASFVLHGMKAPEREIVLKEMKRVARKYVMIHDFYDKTALFIRFLEFMERSDYKNFKKNFKKEMNQQFDNTDLIVAKRGTGVYVGKIREKL
jgi:ubiquinone/menaquinone biosynthesis C-methylase UbiE